MSRLLELKITLAPLRDRLLRHQVYQHLDSVEAIRVLMEHHVFAVWDFMSLLKALQSRLTCVSVPWTPVRNRDACRLVNEIVLAEETDVDADGSTASHFEIYLSAMRDAGADVTVVESLLEQLGNGADLSCLLHEGVYSSAVTGFLRTTFSIIESDDVCQVAAAFAFGREELLPDVFRKMVDRLSGAAEGRLDRFLYYLQRHIQLDGDEHGELAEQLISQLCGQNEKAWTAATQAATHALEARLELWDSIAEQLQSAGSVGAA